MESERTSVGPLASTALLTTKQVLMFSFMERERETKEREGKDGKRSRETAT